MSSLINKQVLRERTTELAGDIQAIQLRKRLNRNEEVREAYDKLLYLLIVNYNQLKLGGESDG